MNLATLGPRKEIGRILVVPDPVDPSEEGGGGGVPSSAGVLGPDAIQLSDEQATEAESLIEDGKQPILWDGRVTSVQDEKDGGFMFVWGNEQQDYVKTGIVPAVPSEIANWRAKAVLEIAGLLPTVEAAIAALPGNTGIVARAAWASGAPFVRTGPTVLALAAQLGLTDEQLDAMFIEAAALQV